MIEKQVSRSSQFCNLCGALNNKDGVGDVAKFVHNEGTQQCETDANRQEVQFTVSFTFAVPRMSDPYSEKSKLKGTSSVVHYYVCIWEEF